MPGLNGIDTLKEIMRRWKLPVIVVSSHSTAGAAITLKALGLGAFDFVAKPADVSARMPEIAAELIGKIKAAAQSKGFRTQLMPESAPVMKTRKQAAAAPTRVAIGISAADQCCSTRCSSSPSFRLHPVMQHCRKVSPSIFEAAR
jgi:two-component system chemotaxis response regulator CheB